VYCFILDLFYGINRPEGCSTLCSFSWLSWRLRRDVHVGVGVGSFDLIWPKACLLKYRIKQDLPVKISLMLRWISRCYYSWNIYCASSFWIWIRIFRYRAVTILLSLFFVVSERIAGFQEGPDHGHVRVFHRRPPQSREPAHRHDVQRKPVLQPKFGVSIIIFL